VIAAKEVLSSVKVVICQLETEPNLVIEAAELIKNGKNNGNIF